MGGGEWRQMGGADVGVSPKKVTHTLNEHWEVQDRRPGQFGGGGWGGGEVTGGWGWGGFRAQELCESPDKSHYLQFCGHKAMLKGRVGGGGARTRERERERERGTG